MSWADMVQAEQCGAAADEHGKPGAFPLLNIVVAKDRAVFTKRTPNGSTPVKAPAKAAKSGVQPFGVNSKSAMSARDGRVMDLEGAVAKQDERISKLEGELSHANHHIRELVAQVDESDRRAEQLAQELADYRKLLMDLERQVQEFKAAAQNSAPTMAPPKITAKDVPTVDIIDAVARVEEAPSTTKVRQEARPPNSPLEAASDKTSPDSAVVVSEDSAETIAKKQSVGEDKRVTARPATEEGPITEPPEGSGVALMQDIAPPTAEAFFDGAAAEQSPNSREADTAFSPAATVSASRSSSRTGPFEKTMPSLPKPSMGPAVAPAPKLSFPIKNGGKINKDRTTTDWAIRAATNIGPASLNAGIPTKDIRDMSLTERNELFRGPAITVMVGKEYVRGIPKHMFMAVSPKVRQYFETKPMESYIAFPAGSITIAVLEALKEYFRHMGSHKNVYSLKLRQDMRQDLSMRRDCVVLGMHKYVAHFTRLYCDKVRQGFLTLDEIALIERYTEDDDALFECLVNNLASRQRRQRLLDANKFDSFLEKHPRLAQAIGRIEARLNNNRRGGHSKEKENSDDARPGVRSQSRSSAARYGCRSPPRVNMAANVPHSLTAAPAPGSSKLPATSSAAVTKQEEKPAAKDDQPTTKAHSEKPPAKLDSNQSASPNRGLPSGLPKAQRGNKIAEYEAKAAAPKSGHGSHVNGE